MTEEIVDEVISDLPKSLSRGFGKQTWGWSLAVDVRISGPKELGLSGSYGVSGSISELAAIAFARSLEKRGFKVSIGSIH